MKRAVLAAVSAISVVTFGSIQANTEQRPQNATVTLSYLGTAGWQISDGKTNLLVDPYLSRVLAAASAPGMPGTPEAGRTKGRSVIGVDDPLVPDTATIDAHIHRADYILVTHSHFDHIMDVPYIAKKTGATVVGTESTTNVMRANGISDGQLITVKGGEDYQFSTFSVMVIPSLHLALNGKHYFDAGVVPATIRIPLRRRDLAEGGTLAFLIRMGMHRILVFGSNNFIEREIVGLRPDVLIAGPDVTPFGPWKEETYDYTSRLMHALGCPRLIIPNHWDNFMLPYSSPQDEYVKRLAPFAAQVKSVCPSARFEVPKYFRAITLEAHG